MYSNKVLRRPIFSIGHSNVTSSQIAKLTKDKNKNGEEQIPKKTKTHPNELVKSIVPLARPEKADLDALEYNGHTCHNSPGDTTSRKDIIKIPTFDSGTPEE